MDLILKKFFENFKKILDKKGNKNPDGNRSSTIFFQEIQELARIEIYLQ
jgi:hypothetical protein